MLERPLMGLDVGRLNLQEAHTYRGYWLLSSLDWLIIAIVVTSVR